MLALLAPVAVAAPPGVAIQAAPQLLLHGGAVVAGRAFPGKNPGVCTYGELRPVMRPK